MRSSLKQPNLRITGHMALVLTILALGGWAGPLLKPGMNVAVAAQKDRSETGGSARSESAPPFTVPAPSAEPQRAAPAENDEYFPRPSAAERKVLDALQNPMSVEFQDTALEDCLAALAEQAKIDIWLDKTKLTEEGVAMDQPATLVLKDRRLESILNLLLRPAHLDYIYEDEVLKITTAISAGEVLLTRTYPVGDLCPELKESKAEDEPAERRSAGMERAEPQIRLSLFQGFGGGKAGAPKEETPTKGDEPANSGGGRGGSGGGGMGPLHKASRFTNLMNALTSTIQPDSWEELSGPGSVVPVAATNSLVIRQTRSVHREVLQLLRDLRAAKRLSESAPRRLPPEAAKNPAGASRREGF